MRVLGKIENTERFVGVALYQGEPLSNPRGSAGSGGAVSSQEKLYDPTFVATAFKKHRFYIFSKREPADQENEKGAPGRDVFNEKPSKEDM